MVHLVFNGVNITNAKSAAINAATGKKVVITLVDGTTNTLSDGTSYEYADGEDEPDATLFVKNNLTINGTGSLNIDSNYATAIKAKDNLIILDSKINIDSVGKAIKGKDSVTVENANITINAEDDGITTDGAMVINSGNINIEKAGEGLEGVTIDINGGNIDITNKITIICNKVKDVNTVSIPADLSVREFVKRYNSSDDLTDVLRQVSFLDNLR